MQKILVIDDEPLFREATALALQRRGYETHEAPDGLAGAEVARSILPDLIVCDVNMERLDGYGLLQKLRADPETAAIPFILMTGMGDSEGMRRGMNLGADDYLHKPFTGLQLFSAVEARLAKQKLLRQSAEKKLMELRVNISLALPHEMITPLNGIFGLAQILSMEANSLTKAEVAEFGTNILESAERLHRTVQNFLLFGQLEMQASDPELTQQVRAKRTGGVAGIVRDRAVFVADKSGRTTDLVFELSPEGLGASVAGDQNLLVKAVDELVDNACKFSPPGSPVKVACRLLEGRLLITITDRGRGMTPEEIAGMGAYAQFNRDKHEQQGSGLGLAIARRIAEIHGGDLTVQSQPDEGTTVSVAFPLSSQQRAAP